MNKKTILLVDDEVNTRIGIQKTLDQWAAGEHRILSASSGEEALHHARQQPVDVVVTDISMPEMNGLSLLAELKNLHPHLVSIVLSAYSEFSYAQEALRLGVVNYLVKPISKTKLIDAVEEALVLSVERTRTSMAAKVADSRVMTARDEAKAAGPVEKAMHYIDSHIDHPLSLAEVAEHVYLNPNYFSMLFKEKTGMTFSEYVTRTRLQEAKQLLLTTDLTIEAVAERTGYSTAKYFSKMFKEFEGVTPGKYKKTNGPI